MDYVEASNLKELHARSDPLLAENVAQILIDMASGLEHMHETATCTWISNRRTC